MTLNQGELHHIYKVKHIHLPLQTERRLEALGLTGGARITIMNKKRHGALIMKLRGTRFAIGRSIADNIVVEEASAQ
ncbi:MAG: FeoA family protein [Blautia sp.]